MEPNGNSIKLSTFLTQLNQSEKSSMVDVRLGSKYASVNMASHLTFLKRTQFIES